MFVNHILAETKARNMPRINIEDKWWSDPRRTNLIMKIGYESDAAMVNAIKISQTYCGEAFDASELLPAHWIDALLSVGLAIGKPTLFYLKGSKEHHKWILEQRERGRKGAQARSNKNNNIRLANAKPPLSNGEASSSSSSSSSNSHSTSTSKELKNKRYDSENTTIVKNEFLQSYQNEFGHVYPGWGAKENSQAGSWLKSVPIAKAIDLCRLYPKWNDPWVTKQGHPFGILVTQYVQLDAWAMSSEKRIQKIAQGRAMENVTVKRAIQREETKNGIREFVDQAGNDKVVSGKDKKQFPSGTTERIPGGAFGLPEGPF